MNILRYTLTSRTSTLINSVFRAGYATNPDAPRILVTGACGQIGSELVRELRNKYGNNNVVASDIIKCDSKELFGEGPYHFADALDTHSMEKLIVENNINWMIHNSGILSAKGEMNLDLAFNVNILGVKNVLDLARNHKLRVLIPSSIAAFGPTTPRDFTPDSTIQRPTTIYGVSKVYLELIGEYYQKKFGVDFRSLRYPGIISNKALPGGGTTDYAVHIFYSALKDGHYKCFLKDNSSLPMMYMPDCIKATMDLLAAEESCLKQRTYNVTAMSFTPVELAKEIQKTLKNFRVEYGDGSDFRQPIADSWPISLDDSRARADWGWNPQYDLAATCQDMITTLRQKLNVK